MDDKVSFPATQTLEEHSQLAGLYEGLHLYITMQLS